MKSGNKYFAEVGRDILAKQSATALGKRVTSVTSYTTAIKRQDLAARQRVSSDLSEIARRSAREHVAVTLRVTAPSGSQRLNVG